MIERVGVHRLHNGNIIHDLGEIGQSFGKFRSAFAMTGEFEIRREERGIGLDEGVGLSLHHFLRHRFAVPFHQRRLVIEHVELAGRSGLE